MYGKKLYITTYDSTRAFVIVYEDFVLCVLYIFYFFEFGLMY